MTDNNIFTESQSLIVRGQSEADRAYHVCLNKYPTDLSGGLKINAHLLISFPYVYKYTSREHVSSRPQSKH